MDEVIKKALEIYERAAKTQIDDDYYWNDKSSKGKRMLENLTNFKAGWNHDIPEWLTSYIEMAKNQLKENRYELYLELKEEFEKEK